MVKRFLAKVLAVAVLLTSIDVSGITVSAATDDGASEECILIDDEEDDTNRELFEHTELEENGEADESGDFSISEENTEFLVESEYFKGEGTKENPYLIESVRNLEEMAKFYSDDNSSTYYFKLNNSITVNSDMSNPRNILSPINSNKNMYFDGDGNTIYGLCVNGAGNVALFQKAYEVKNLTVQDAIINITKAVETQTNNCAVICSYVDQKASNCELKGDIVFNYGESNSYRMGGLFGECRYVSDCKMLGNITVNGSGENISAAGIVCVSLGRASEISVEDCCMEGNIILHAKKNCSASGIAVSVSNIYDCVSGDSKLEDECLISVITESDYEGYQEGNENACAYGIADVSSNAFGCTNYASIDAVSRAVGITGSYDLVYECTNYGKLLRAKQRMGIAEYGSVQKCENRADIQQLSEDVNCDIYGIVKSGDNICSDSKNYGNLTGHNVYGIIGSIGPHSVKDGTFIISGCTNYGELRGYNAFGIAGSLGNDYFKDDIHGYDKLSECVNEGTIHGQYAAGIIGRLRYGSTVTNCFNLGDITGDDTGSESAAGIALQVDAGAVLTECANNGNITGGDVGGICTRVWRFPTDRELLPIIRGCSNSGTLKGTYEVAGIVSTLNGGTVIQCFNSGAVSLANDDPDYHRIAGGIIGDVYTNFDAYNEISDCYNSGAVTAGDCGGIIGYAASDENIGGIAISNCYNIGTLIPFEDKFSAFHIIGNNNFSDKVGITVSGCYYPSNGQGGIWLEDGEKVSGMTECSYEAMKSKSTYVGWDFDSIWTMGTGEYKYPVLMNTGEKQFTITFDANGGTTDVTTLVTTGLGKLASLPRPKYEGMRFCGWYTLPEGGDRITTATVFSGNTTIYAHWKDYDPSDRVAVAPVSPENGGKNFRYIDEGGWVNFEVSFTTDIPVKSINVKEGKLRLVEYSSDTVIYETESSNSVKIKAQGSGSKVYFSFFNSGIKPATEYYIEIDEGFMSFDDAAKFAYVEKDDWVFSTAYKNKITIRNEAEGYEKDTVLDYEFYYDDSMFADTANKYDQQRTIWAFGLAMSGFESYKGGYSDGSKNARSMMTQFGFDTDPKLSPNADYKEKPAKYSFGVCVGDKKIKDKDGKTYTLLAVATRGAGYEEEWYSNGYVGKTTEHEGFYLASNKVLSQIASYINARGITGDIKIVMAGYSRAAATTNIAAARINDGELANMLSGTNITITPDNVYAYCFECPATTRKADVSGLSIEEALQTNYTNITNILNPSDFVPFVPLDGLGWGYKRYGIDYYLPNELLNSKGYGEYREQFLNRYSQFGLTYDNSAFKYYKIVWPSSDSLAAGNLKSLVGKKISKTRSIIVSDNMPIYTFNIKFRTELKQAVPSWWQYETYLQSAVCPILSESFTDGNAPWAKLAENCDFIVGETPSIVTSDLFDCLLTLYKNVKTYKLGLLFQQHEPLLNFAMLVSTNGNLQPKVLHNEIESFHVVYLNCPVDVSVYNSSGELVAQIVDDTPVSIDGSFIGCYIDENGQKVLILPKDDDFRIAINGTDTGTMDYAISEYSLTAQEYVNKTVYCDIPVKDGTQLTATVDDNGENILKDDNQTALIPMQEFTDSIPEYNVSVITEGAGSIQGSSKVPAGNHVLLTAIPDIGAEFEGWYDTDGNLVSEEEDYRFRVDADTQYTARFKEREGFTAVVEEDLTYTGAKLKPEVKVYDGARELTAGKDYSISFKNNKNVYTYAEKEKGFDASKAPAVIVTGKGNYKGKETTYFVINPKSVADSDVVVSAIADQKEDGKAKNPVPTVKFGKTKLKAGRDFTVTYLTADEAKTDCTAVGEYIARITGKGNYTGTTDCSFVIYSKDSVHISKAKLQKIADTAYTSEARDISPDVKLSYNKAELTEGTDYKIVYNDDHKSVGKKSITILGIGAFAGSRTATYNITGKSIKKAAVTGLNAQVDYSGSEITQNPVLTLNGSVLTQGIDYEAVYSGNLNVGKATVTFNGINGYTGSLKKKFSIKSKALNNTDFELTVPESSVFVKGGSTPEITLTFKGKLLELGKDYTVSYKNNKAVTGTSSAGKALVKVAGKGNFSGSLSKEFEITASDLSRDGIRMTANDVVATGKPGKWASVPVITDIDGKTLKAGTDYEKEIKYYVTIDGDDKLLTATDVVEAGTAIKAVATGKGSYSNIAETTYRIVKKDISKASVKVDAKTFTGKGVTLSPEDITITFQNETLSEKDYVIDETTYKNNARKGKATVVIRGVGDYGGCKTVTFTIGPKGILWWFRNLLQ